MPLFILRRLFTLCVTLFAVSLIVFALFQAAPGDPAVMIAGLNASQEQLSVIREKLNLDAGPAAQYVYWLRDIIRADFGTSIQYGLPVRELVFDRLLISAALAAESLAITVCLAVPAGIFMAYKRRSAAAAALRHLTVIGLSVPHYFFSILIALLFGLVLRVFVPGQFFHYSDDAAAFWQSLFFPALAAALPNCCVLAQSVYTSAVGELSGAYVRTARSKGAGEWRILTRHVMPNALRQILTMAGMIAADICSGTVVAEQVFGIPGMGRLLISGIARRDFPLVMAVTVYVSAVIVIVNCAVEIVIRIIDPRVRTAGGS